MTDKVQKIREEVARLMNELIQEKEKGFGSDADDACILELLNVLTYIDSLQEEPNILPVFDEGYWERLGEEPVSEDLEKASKEWLRPQLDKSYANYGEAKMMELTHFDGYAMLDAIEFGAKWQFERVNEALLSEVLPCFMHGGETDEVVAKLDEVLNQKK